MKNTLRLVGRGSGLLVLLLAVLPPVLLTLVLLRRWQRREWHDKVVSAWSRALVKVFGLTITHTGQPENPPVFLVANHVSWLDIPVIHSATTAGFVAKAEIAQWPLLGWVVKCGETVFHQRGRSDSRQRVLQALQQRLKEGRSVAVFPEGKTTDGSALGRFHRPLLQAAVETQSPIQPVAIEYWDHRHQRHEGLPFHGGETFLHNVWRLLQMPAGEVHVHWLPPLSTTANNGKMPETRALAEKAQQAIYQQLHQDNYWAA